MLRIVEDPCAGGAFDHAAGIHDRDLAGHFGEAAHRALKGKCLIAWGCQFFGVGGGSLMVAKPGEVFKCSTLQVRETTWHQ